MSYLQVRQRMWRWFSHIFTYFHISPPTTYTTPTRHLHWSYTGPTPSKRSLPSVLAELPTTNAYPWWLSPWCSPRKQFPRSLLSQLYNILPAQTYSLLVIHAVCQMWTSYKISTWSNLNRIGQINWHMFFPLTSQGRALRRKGCLEPGSQCSWWSAIAARWTLCVNSFLRTQWIQWIQRPQNHVKNRWKFDLTPNPYRIPNVYYINYIYYFISSGNPPLLIPFPVCCILMQLLGPCVQVQASSPSAWTNHHLSLP